MIQLQYSEVTSSFQNKVFWSDTQFTGSTVILALTSSFEGDYSTIGGDVVSNKSSNIGGWVQFTVSSSDVPTTSGFYEANIYEGCVDEPVRWNNAVDVWNTVKETWEDWAIGCLIPAVWNTTATKWNEVNAAWENYLVSEAGITQLIVTDRVFVSGSDYDPTYKYENQELSYYSVYNG